jgi:hypothetical protein
MTFPFDLVKYCFLAVCFPMMYSDPGAGKRMYYQKCSLDEKKEVRGNNIKERE